MTSKPPLLSESTVITSHLSTSPSIDIYYQQRLELKLKKGEIGMRNARHCAGDIQNRINVTARILMHSWPTSLVVEAELFVIKGHGFDPFSQPCGLFVTKK